MSKEGSTIHLKLENFEAVQSKRGILETEESYLKILQSIKKFHELRMEELNLKMLAKKEIKSLNIKISKLKQLLPTLRMPKILEKKGETINIKETNSTKPKKITHKSNLESQLEEIQNKLKRLQE